MLARKRSSIFIAVLASSLMAYPGRAAIPPHNPVNWGQYQDWKTADLFDYTGTYLLFKFHQTMDGTSTDQYRLNIQYTGRRLTGSYEFQSESNTDSWKAKFTRVSITGNHFEAEYVLESGSDAVRLPQKIEGRFIRKIPAKNVKGSSERGLLLNEKELHVLTE